MRVGLVDLKKIALCGEIVWKEEGGFNSIKYHIIKKDIDRLDVTNLSGIQY